MASIGGPGNKASEGKFEEDSFLGQEIPEETNLFETSHDQEVRAKIGEIPRLKALAARTLALNNLPIHCDDDEREVLSSEILSKREDDEPDLLDEVTMRKRAEELEKFRFSMHSSDLEKAYVDFFIDRVVPNYDDGSKKLRDVILIDKKSYLEKHPLESKKKMVWMKRPTVGSRTRAQTNSHANAGSLFRWNFLDSVTSKITAHTSNFFHSIWGSSAQKEFQSIEQFSDMSEDTLIDLINVGFYENTLKEDKETLSSLFLIAVRDKKYQLANQLLDKYPIEIDVNWKDTKGMTPLMYAVLNQNPDMVGRLIRAEVDPNQNCMVLGNYFIKILLSKNKQQLIDLTKPLFNIFNKTFSDQIEKNKEKIYASLDDEKILNFFNLFKDKLKSKFDMSPEELVKVIKEKLKSEKLDFNLFERLPSLIDKIVETIPADSITYSVEHPPHPRETLPMRPLQIAAIDGNLDILKLLINENTDSRELYLVLKTSAFLGHTHIIKYLIERKLVDMNSHECSKLPPLIVATFAGKNETVEFLLQNGAKKELSFDLSFLPHSDDISDTKLTAEKIALIIATISNNFEMLRIFERYGTDFEDVIKDEKDLQAFSLFLNLLFSQKESLNYLSSIGAEINTRTEKRRITPFFGVTVLLSGMKTVSKTLLDVVSYKLFRVNIGGKIAEGIDVFLEIISNKMTTEELLEFFSLGSYIFATYLNSEKILHGKLEETIEELRRRKANESIPITHNITPLMASVLSSDIEFIEKLLDDEVDPANRSDPNARNSRGQTALHLVAENMHAPFGTQKFRKEAIELLLKNGADPNLQDQGGIVVLMRYVEDPEITIMLLNAGADPDISDSNGRSTLHYAVDGSDEVFKLILDN
ncbi:MAG: hypothetical protein K940chlam1_00480, partial [Candidatus Anoxychlamydiales bacterium]|nr:hypothetical protein [Candidatus Anoxychlamydiales bacterium]